MPNNQDEVPVVIYHANCIDGMGAAWVAWKYFRGVVELVPCNYGKPPPQYINRNIFIVDFSFPRAQLEDLAKVNHVVTVLDHHKTAAADLEGLPPPGGIGLYELIRKGGNQFTKPIYALFDMKRSGAGITWDYFFPMETRPSLIDYIEDRDLWKFELPDSRQVHGSLASYGVEDFDKFDGLVTQASNPDGLLELISDGQAIDRRQLQMTNEIIKAGKREMLIHGFKVPVCNAPFPFASDMGHIMSQGQPFAATYFDLGDGRRQFSLRSNDDGVDVSLIAKFYGGGGHRNAAGFTAVAGWEGDTK